MCSPNFAFLFCAEHRHARNCSPKPIDGIKRWLAWIEIRLPASCADAAIRSRIGQSAGESSAHFVRKPYGFCGATEAPRQLGPTEPSKPAEVSEPIGSIPVGSPPTRPNEGYCYSSSVTAMSESAGSSARRGQRFGSLA